MKATTLAVFLSLPTSVAWSADALILADTNRDGLVDDADEADKAQWSAARGAILLPNIGDVRKRCPSSSNLDVTDAQLEKCNDAEGNEPRAPEYFAPLRTMAFAGATSRAQATVSALGPGADRIRIFVKRGSRWVFFPAGASLTVAEISNGAAFGVDSRDVVRDASRWDGRVTIELSVTDGERVSRDSVAMRVAPVLTHHPVEKAVEVFAPQSRSAFIAHQRFVKDFEGALRDAGFSPALRRLNTTDVWAQDFVEFGYVSMPKSGGGFTLLNIAIRSPQPGRAGGRAVFDLRGPGMGAIQIGGDDYHQADSFGNLETVPPYEYRGVRYPAGRIIYGDVGDGLAPHVDMQRFFRSQEVQAPIVLDTSWLVIGHVDEFVQFVAADTPRGWKIAVLDVGLALEVLRDAQRRGLGGARVYSREGAPTTTIDQALANTELMRQNELARRKIDLNIGILKSATGVTDDEIVRIPGLFKESEMIAARRRQNDPQAAVDKAPPPAPVEGLTLPREKIVYGPGTLAAFYPGAINGVVLDAHNYVAPKAWGPLESGKDIMQAAVDRAYGTVGLKVWSIDDWDSHHRIGGEVHCGSNTIRAVTTPWW